MNRSDENSIDHVPQLSLSVSMLLALLLEVDGSSLT